MSSWWRKEGGRATTTTTLVAGRAGATCVLAASAGAGTDRERTGGVVPAPGSATSCPSRATWPRTARTRPGGQDRGGDPERIAQAREAAGHLDQARRFGGRADSGGRLGRGSDELVKVDKVSVVIGEMASGATIPVAQSVTIPNRIVRSLRPRPRRRSRSDQGQRLPLADPRLGHAAGPRARAGGRGRVRARARRSTSGPATTRSASRCGSSSSRSTRSSGQDRRPGLLEPDAGDLRQRGRRARRRKPQGFVMIDFPETFEKMAPALVRTGKWSRRRR